MRLSVHLLLAAALLAAAIAAAPARAQTAPQPQPPPGTPFGPVTPAAPPEVPTQTEPTNVGRPDEEGLEGPQMLLMLGISVALIGGVLVMIARDGRVKRAAAGQRQRRVRGTGALQPARPKGGPPPPPRKKSARSKAKAKRR